MAILNGVSAFSRCAASVLSAFAALFCSGCWKPRRYCKGDKETSLFPLDAVGAYDLKIVVPISGITSMIFHSSGNSSRYLHTGPSNIAFR